MALGSAKKKQYDNLRKSRTVMILFSRLAFWGLILAAAVAFYQTMQTVIANRDRMTNTAVIDETVLGSVIVLGLILAAFVVHRVLRTVADLFDVLVDTQAESRRAAEVVENQLLPLVHAMERHTAMPEAERARRWEQRERDEAGETPLAQAVQAVRHALQQEYWKQAEKLAEDLRQQHPDSDEAAGIGQEIVEAKRKRRQMLAEQARAAGLRQDWDALGRVRDRLLAFVPDEQLPALDDQLANELLRASVALQKQDKRREAAAVIQHIIEAFPETRAAGKLRARSAAT